MKLNNKGFAITGILYTLFILFLLILVSILGGLSSKKNMLEQSIISQENSFIGTKIEPAEKALKDNITIVTGKYVFSISGVENTKCTAYLKRGINIKKEKITYIPGNCNEYEQTMILEEVYSFEKE